MKRFDEVELISSGGDSGVLSSIVMLSNDGPPSASGFAVASRLRRTATFLSDLSLFLALGVAMTTLLRTRESWVATLEREWPAVLSLAGFIVLLSFFYFVGCWLIWGKTVGGAIFDVRVVQDDGVAMDLLRCTKRWAWTLVSILTLGLGFLPALLPGTRSMADRMSGSVSMIE